MKRLALLGGTFDPFHNGHLFLARRLPQVFGCPLRLIPNGCPPHRAAPAAPFAARLEMCRLGVCGLPQVSVGEEEKPPDNSGSGTADNSGGDGGGYTIDTLRLLRRQYPSTSFLLVLGSDAAAAFSRWRQPAQILTHAHIVIVPRAGLEKESAQLNFGIKTQNKSALTSGCGYVYVWSEEPPPLISATHCRRLLASGQAAEEEISALIPPAVAAFIAKQKLYG